MCGRYTLGYDAYELAEEYGVDDVPTAYSPRPEIPPGTAVAVVGLKPDGVRRGIVLLQWGFVPRWANSLTDGPKPINARAETAADSPPFRDSFRDRRCLIPATGFYEWSTAEGSKKKTPYLFTPTVRPVVFAGLWDYWPGPPVHRSCAIITVPANGVVRPLHDRMPAILGADKFRAWLDPATSVADLRAMLVPFPDDGLTVAPAELKSRVASLAARKKAAPPAPDLFAGAES